MGSSSSVTPSPRAAALCSEVSGGDSLGWPCCAEDMLLPNVSRHRFTESPAKHLSFAGGRAVGKGLLPAELLSPCLQEAARRNPTMAEIQEGGNPH